MLSDDEILRRLRLVRHTPWNKRIGKGNKDAVTIASIARQTGLTRVCLHNIMSGKASLGESARRMISQLFECKTEHWARGIAPHAEPSSPILTIRGVSDAFRSLI